MRDNFEPSSLSLDIFRAGNLKINYLRPVLLYGIDMLLSTETIWIFSIDKCWKLGQRGRKNWKFSIGTKPAFELGNCSGWNKCSNIACTHSHDRCSYIPYTHVHAIHFAFDFFSICSSSISFSLSLLYTLSLPHSVSGVYMPLWALYMYILLYSTCLCMFMHDAGRNESIHHRNPVLSHCFG